MAPSSNFITRATRKQALEERGLIRSQMRLGAGLIALGAGAAMLPTEAAAGASARILRSLPDQDDGANQRGALNGRPDETSILSGVEASNGQGNSRHGGQ